VGGTCSMQGHRDQHRDGLHDDMDTCNDIRHCRFGGFQYVNGAWVEASGSLPGRINAGGIRKVRGYVNCGVAEWEEARAYARNQARWFCGACRQRVKRLLEAGGGRLCWVEQLQVRAPRAGVLEGRLIWTPWTATLRTLCASSCFNGTGSWCVS
jgi:hypothetical protein